MLYEKATGSAEVDDPCAGENFHATRAWLAALASAVFLMLGSAVLNMMTPILPLVLSDFGESTNYGSSLSSVVTFVAAFVAVPAAWAVNKWGYRVVGYFGYGLMIATAALGTFCDSSAGLFFVRALQGVAHAIPATVCVYTITQWFPRSKQALPIAFMAAIQNFSKVISLQVSKLAIAFGGWHAHFFGMGVLFAVGLLLYIFFMRPGPGHALAIAERKNVEEAKRRAKAKAIANNKDTPLIRAFKNPYIMLLILAMCCYTLGQRMFTPFSNMIYMSTTGVSNDTASDIGSLLSACMFVCELCEGFIMASPHFKRKGLFFAIFLSIHCFGLATCYVMNAPWQAWLFAAVIGLTGGIPCFVQMCIPRFTRSPAVLAMSMSLYMLLGKDFSGTVGPFIASGIQTVTGSWSAVAIPVLIVAIFGSFALFVVGRRLDRLNEAQRDGGD